MHTTYFDEDDILFIRLPSRSWMCEINWRNFIAPCRAMLHNLRELNSGK